MEKTAAPKELYLSIAILLKNNLLLLGDLIPYVSAIFTMTLAATNRHVQLYPTEAEMEEAKTQYNANMNREITTNSGGALAVSWWIHKRLAQNSTDMPNISFMVH